ncbi:two-component sensor histidine kinase [Streptomyces albospinus]|uniref:histidine kinase n=1 Tax=Streptomyces albospinus TaxID=285515 RepID=A0ABQ2V657_9ACTN|nr:HAMP domain-containing sensor histidine kinase [Streptomyces albospinus]GGU70870.1 two-component sensor histidine kinase [Streptomyces albospinus]
MGLRTRTALVIALTTALAATVIGFLVHHRTAQNQRKAAGETVDAVLLDALSDAATGTSTTALIDPPDLPAALRTAVTQRPVRATYLENRGGTAGPVLWAAARHGDSIIAVRRSYAPQVRALADLDGVLMGSGAATTVLGCVAGVVAAAGVGRRIGASVRTAQQIADGDLTARVPAAGNDEIARLGAAVNAMADALNDRLEAERRVTADIAHELRTPVAGMVTAAGLLPPGRPTELVTASAAALRDLVEDVLEVARLDVPGVEQAQCEDVRVSALARRAVGQTGRDAEVVVHEDATVRTDPRRAERILANLVANAYRHAAPPVEVQVDGATVRVRDHGPGFPADLLTQGPRRFRTGARGTGLGLGLTIVVGQARVLGARVRFDNLPDGGALATLSLTPESSGTPETSDAPASPPPTDRGAAPGA